MERVINNSRKYRVFMILLINNIIKNRVVSISGGIKMTISSMQKLLEGFDSLNNNEEIKEDYEEDVIHILGPIFTSLWEKEMLEEKRYKKRKNLIANDVMKNTYYGKTLNAYEEYRKKEIEEIAKEKNELLKIKHIRKLSRKLKNIPREFAYQRNFKNVYEQKIKSVIIQRLLKTEKLTVKEISEITDVSEERIVFIDRSMVKADAKKKGLRKVEKV